MTSINRGGGRASGRLEQELTSWLAGFELVAAPIALRIRTSADLRDVAERRRRRFAWIKPALSLSGSVLAIGGTAFAFMAVVMLANSIDRSGFGGVGASPTPEQPPLDGSFALLSTIVAVTGVFAGLSLYLGLLRRAFARLTFGESTATPGALLPLRRPRRAFGRRDAALAALTLATAVLAVLQCLDYLRTGMVADEVVGLLILELGMAAFALVIVWRYPLGDRPTRLLLAGAILALAYLWSNYAVYWIPGPWSFVNPQILPLLTLFLLPMAAQVTLVAGLAARLNLRAGPPLALAAVLVALGFMETRYVTAADSTVPLLLTQLTWIVQGLNQWLVTLAWLAAAWLGYAGFRRTRTRGWLVVLAAGAIGGSAYAGVYLMTLLFFFDSEALIGTWIWLAGLANGWYHLGMALAEVLLVAALAIGLVPVSANEAPAAETTVREAAVEEVAAPPA
jgi:hypothetical protein